MIGLCFRGSPVLGVVHAPASETPKMYYAVTGKGAFVLPGDACGEGLASSKRIRWAGSVSSCVGPVMKKETQDGNHVWLFLRVGGTHVSSKFGSVVRAVCQEVTWCDWRAGIVCTNRRRSIKVGNGCMLVGVHVPTTFVSICDARLFGCIVA